MVWPVCLFGSISLIAPRCPDPVSSRPPCSVLGQCTYPGWEGPCPGPPPPKLSSVSAPVDGSRPSRLRHMHPSVLPRTGLFLPFKYWPPTRHGPVTAGTTSHSSASGSSHHGVCFLPWALHTMRDAATSPLGPRFCGEKGCRLGSEKQTLRSSCARCLVRRARGT